jgi:metallo-beta-lactamase class B
MSAKLAFASVALLAGCAALPAAAPLTDASASQRAWAATCEDSDGWDEPGPPYRVYGRTYYVGTCGISSLLVVSPEGHALIDSGTDKGAQIVLANIRALGFDPKDVAILLMSHEHFDHVGGMARLQEATGATIVATPQAAAVLRSGKPGRDDPQANSGHPVFPPVTGPIIELERGEPQLIGDTAFTPIATPGHTPGALTWTWRECEGDECKSIAYVDSLNPISSDGYRFSDHPAYLAAFRAGLASVEALDCDIVIAPHPSAAHMRERLLGEAPLIDRNGCKAYVASVRGRLEKRLATERDGG